MSTIPSLRRSSPILHLTCAPSLISSRSLPGLRLVPFSLWRGSSLSFLRRLFLDRQRSILSRPARESTVWLESLEPRCLLSAVLVQGINPRPSASSPSLFAAVREVAFFSAASLGEYGEEEYSVWRSDGTEAGTELVQDIFADPDSAFRFSRFWSPLLNANGVLFFAADDGVHGKELWTLFPSRSTGRLWPDGAAALALPAGSDAPERQPAGDAEPEPRAAPEPPKPVWPTPPAGRGEPRSWSLAARRGATLGQWLDDPLVAHA